MLHPPLRRSVVGRSVVGRSAVGRTVVGRTVVAVAAVLALVAGVSCSDESDGRAEPADTTTSTTTTFEGGDAHGSSAMDPEVRSVAEIAAEGPGPSVGDRWGGWIGLNVCGRFLEVPAVAPGEGIEIGAGGLVTYAPGAGDPVGHDLTVATVLERLGVDLSTGTFELSEGTVPAEVETTDTTLAVAGATLRTGDRCGAERAEVQLWYYTPEAVDSGEVALVVTDPEQAPVVADGTAFVVAFSPESSLPTLPPAVLVD